MSNKLTVRRHKIAALKHARKKIKDKSDDYICRAIEDYLWTTEDADADKACDYLTQYIAKNLNSSKNTNGKYSTGNRLEDWLDDVHIRCVNRFGGELIIDQGDIEEIFV